MPKAISFLAPGLIVAAAIASGAIWRGLKIVQAIPTRLEQLRACH